MKLRLVPFAALLASGCMCGPPPPEAPSALDENLRWFWVNGAALDDKALLDGAAKLAAAGDADNRVKALKGQLPKRLEPADLAGVGLEATNDPSTARGLMVLNAFDCTLDKLQAILIALDQKAQYDGVYDAYERTYSSDSEAFASGAAATLSWEVDLKASLPVNDTYSSHLKGSIRRVSAAADAATKGPFLIVRTYLPAPATFAASSTSWFKQDYQIELFWEAAPGRIFHAYGMWRDMKVGGLNLTLEDNSMMTIVLDNLVKWDDTTVQLCKKP
jgi:hypothetical protein